MGGGHGGRRACAAREGAFRRDGGGGTGPAGRARPPGGRAGRGAGGRRRRPQAGRRRRVAPQGHVPQLLGTQLRYGGRVMSYPSLPPAARPARGGCTGFRPSRPEASRPMLGWAWGSLPPCDIVMKLIRSLRCGCLVGIICSNTFGICGT